MSELIDRIFDIEKIKKDKEDIEKMLDSLKTDIAGYSSAIESLLTLIRKSKDMETLANQSGQLNDNFHNGRKVVDLYTETQKQLENQQRLLIVSEAKLATATNETAQAIDKNKRALKEQNDLLKAENILNDANAGSLEKAAASNTKLGIEKKKLNLETAEGRKRLAEINAEQDKNNELIQQSGNNLEKQKINIGNYQSAFDGLLDQFKSGEINIAGLGRGVVALGKQMMIAFVTNPVFLTLAAIVLLIKGVSSAISDSEERSNKFSLVMAKLQPILRTIGDIFEFIADAVLVYIDAMASAYAAVTEFLGINPKGSADEFVNAEKAKQKAITETRKLNEDASKQEAIIAEQREIMSDKENNSFSKRQLAFQKAKNAETQLSKDRVKIAQLNFDMIKKETDLDDNNAEANDRLTAAKIALNKATEEGAALGRKLNKEQAKLIKENEADLKAEADAAKSAMDKIIAARRRLVDSSFALMVESREKQLKLSTEMYNREIEDLKRNGELTKALATNLQLKLKQDIDKINKEWNAKDLNDKIKADELILDNMKKAGDDTLSFEKQLLQKRMDAEIMAGGDALEIRQKYQYLQKDLEAKNADDRFKLFEETLKKEVEALKDGYDKQAKEAKEAYARGKISKAQYEAKLVDIQAEAMREANKKTIELLKMQLNSAELSADKRAELSKKIAQLEIDNENAVTDATIKANEERTASDKDAAEKRKQIASDLLNAGMELFGAIGEYQVQQSEQRIAEFEKEQEASDSAFEADQNKLDNAIMSDETRAAKQKELNEKKAASDKALADKIQAEKIKQAKWEKAQGIISAIISTAQGVAGALAMMPWSPLNLVFAALAATSGAVQIATIASQQIPAYEMGTDNHPGGVSLWGEKRPEVAVTPSGETFLATAPTITDFQAGTRIYKSVSDYEAELAKQAVKEVTFDYDKFGEMMPRLDFEFDGAGLFSVRDKIGNRRTMINRRHKR